MIFQSLISLGKLRGDIPSDTTQGCFAPLIESVLQCLYFFQP